MGKEQVTVALQAVGLRGPLYSPRLVVSLGSTGDQHELVVLNKSYFGLEEVGRYNAPTGPVTSHTALLWSALVGDALYHHLCMAVGIQGEFEDLPLRASPPPL